MFGKDKFKLVILFVSLGFPMLSPNFGNAITLVPNSSYVLDGGNVGLIFDRLNNINDYIFLLSPVIGKGSVTTGNLVGNHLSAITLSSDFQITIYDYNTGSGNVGAAVGTANGALSAQWTNAVLAANSSVAGSRPNESAGGGFFFNVSGELGGQHFSTAIGLGVMSATVQTGQYAGTYDNAIANLGDTWTALLGNAGAGSTSSLHGWLVGDTTNFLGDAAHIGGDIHLTVANTAAVPEPASIALIGLGMLGGLARKRKMSA